MDSKFYVYEHRYASGNKRGEPFYVGKGSGKRAFVQSGRGVWWRRIVKKYGYYVEIVQCLMKEDDAFLLEMWLIAKYKHIGKSITNATIGGEGTSYVEGRDNPLWRKVYCSNGMIFTGAKEASEWVQREFGRNSSSSMICSCCRGVKKSAYGFAWSYNKTPDAPEDGRENYMKKIRKKVYCSNGMVFNSCMEAANWLKTIGHKNATGVNVGSCASGKVNTAHGYAWSYKETPKMNKTHRELVAESKSKKVLCSNGMLFNSIKSAADWAKMEGLGSSGSSVISRCAKGKQSTAYGLKWSFV